MFKTILTFILLAFTFFAYALSNITLPNFPSHQFYKITAINHRMPQRDRVSIPYSITADGTGTLQVTATITGNSVPCSTGSPPSNPLDNPDASCMENIDDPHQKVYFEILYKPCGYSLQSFPLTKTGQDSFTLSLSNPTQYNPSSCQEYPTLTQGALVFIRFPISGDSSYDPSAGLYTAGVNLSVSAA